MAATAFTPYYSTKEYLGKGTIDLSTTGIHRLHIIISGGGASVLTISTLGSLQASELASGNGYSRSGYSLNTTWTSSAAGTWRFDAASVVVSANGGALNFIQWGVVVASTGASAKDPANKVVAVSKLSTGSIDLSDGSTLTVDFNANGIFEMS